jgi:glycosyltransferase involved in cell wall biosynthesis
MALRVLHVVGSFYPAVGYGGPIVSNRALCGALAGLGIEVQVLTTNTDGTRKLPKEFSGWRPFEGYEIFYGNRWLWRDLSPGLARELGRQVPTADVVHLTGTYNWFLPLAGRLCRRHGKPLVVSPRGSLMAEARGSKGLKKRLFDRLVQGRALSRVAAFHATSEEEARALRELVPGARVAVIPNGVEVPEVLPRRDPAAGPYGLYLGRLHPYKRVERIIGAFARGGRTSAVGGRWSGGRCDDGSRMTDGRGEGASAVVVGRSSVVTTNWSLLIAGDGEERYKAALRKLTEDLGLTGAVRFVGHVEGEEKARLLAGAEFVVLASHSENFGMSVAEALAHGTPCVVSKTAPWEGLDREGCGFWVEDSEEALADGMRRLMTLSAEERRAMGMRGRAWMAREFSWEGVGKRMVELYESLVEEKKSVVGGR